VGRSVATDLAACRTSPRCQNQRNMIEWRNERKIGKHRPGDADVVSGRYAGMAA
jgi:hypothetical protein